MMGDEGQEFDQDTFRHVLDPGLAIQGNWYMHVLLLNIIKWTTIEEMMCPQPASLISNQTSKLGLCLGKYIWIVLVGRILLAHFCSECSLGETLKPIDSYIEYLQTPCLHSNLNIYLSSNSYTYIKLVFKLDDYGDLADLATSLLWVYLSRILNMTSIQLKMHQMYPTNQVSPPPLNSFIHSSIQINPTVVNFTFQKFGVSFKSIAK